ncbi:sulfur carrier protein ThiS [Labrys monachus]|uniref:Sulfur carrier protein n=1 Tax=Labrys monachus TaxID=217067 RepID=A0ABU0FMF4_9HYPH|nr:sulfur carrier protein ThiS [Labrys monachus]MDQ0395656.1 sulfur carrier protein [Labrys monachus]
MTLIINGEARDVAAPSLAALLEALELDAAVVATAVNGRFVRRADRMVTLLAEGDAIEILAPMQGG